MTIADLVWRLNLISIIQGTWSEGKLDDICRQPWFLPSDIDKYWVSHHLFTMIHPMMIIFGDSNPHFEGFNPQ